MPYLVFERRGQFHMQVPLEEGRATTVGRQGAEVTVVHSDVAPIQAAFVFDKEKRRWQLFDRSGALTEVDGRRVDRAVVSEGSRILFGDYEARFTLNPLEPPQRREADETSPAKSALNALPAELVVVAEIPGQPGSRREARLGAKLEIGSRVAVPGLLLPERGISRLHATITRHLGRLMLHDPGSTNGTWSALGRVYEIALRLGARFRIGSYELWVEEPRGKQDQPEAPAGKQLFAGMISGDPAMHRLFAEIRRVAPLAFAVLIQGESGTGKERVAQALHDFSERAKGPWIDLNCATLGEMAESELFGHKRGSFTGAIGDRPGAFQTADGGTLFLDEAGDLPLPVQAKLLRVLETGEVKPLGSDRTVKVDVRVVAASNKLLPAEIHAGRFRADLFHRLNGEQLVLPALRDRLGDVKLIWETLLAERRPVEPITTSPEAMEKLVKYRWPGNVRELLHELERAIGRCGDRRQIEVRDLVLDNSAHPGGAAPVLGNLVDPTGKTWAEIQADNLAGVMRAVKGNRAEACRQLGIDKKRLRRMLKEYGLEKMGREEED